MTYSEKLKDKRWQQKRMEVLTAANWKCEDCGRDDNQMLEVHHCAYIRDVEPWQYAPNLLMALCGDCHKYRQDRENTLRVTLGIITRQMAPADLENEVWAILDGVYQRQTEKYAEAFGA